MKDLLTQQKVQLQKIKPFLQVTVSGDLSGYTEIWGVYFNRETPKQWVFVLEFFQEVFGNVSLL